MLFDWFIDNHSGNWSPVLLLLRSIKTVRGSVDGETVYKLLDRKILDFPKVISIIFLIDADHAARTCCVHSAQARVVLNDIGTLGKRKMGDRAMRIERKNRHCSVTAA